MELVIDRNDDVVVVVRYFIKMAVCVCVVSEKKKDWLSIQLSEWEELNLNEHTEREKS